MEQSWRMKILFVHQNFPGQYLHLARSFADQPEHQVLAIGKKQNLGRLRHPRVREIGYDEPDGAGQQTHHYLRQLEAAVRQGQNVVRIAQSLRLSGFEPDIVGCHPGWGEGLYLRDVWRRAPLLYFFEFYYHAVGYDTGFDPEFPISLDTICRTRTRNALHLLSLNVADWGLSPTRWQFSAIPEAYRPKISVIHDGIDTGRVTPSRAARLEIDETLTLGDDDEVITFINRNLEPYRGYHIFMRALPRLLAERPAAHIVLIGGDGVSYGAAPRDAPSHRQKYLDEVKDRVDLSRVHFLDRVPYERFLSVLRVSSVHVYLTYPFVLSWSLLEAMSAGCAVVASATPPVEEFVRHEENGLLFDFFDPDALVDGVVRVLSHPARLAAMRANARQTIVDHYDLKTVCLPRQRALVEAIAAGQRPAGGGPFETELA